jgi:hypothetical protein
LIQLPQYRHCAEFAIPDQENGSAAGINWRA